MVRPTPIGGGADDQNFECLFAIPSTRAFVLIPATPGQAVLPAYTVPFNGPDIS